MVGSLHWFVRASEMLKILMARAVFHPNVKHLWSSGASLYLLQYWGQVGLLVIP